MNKSHVIKLKPTKSQETFFRKSCGVARFTYNWALNKWQEDYKNGIKWTGYSLRKYFNSIKRVEFPWTGEVGKCATDYPILNVEKAFRGMWRGDARHPKFKKKGDKDSYVAVESKEKFKQKDFKIWVPRLGWVKCCENLRFEGKVNHVIIKRRANMWFAHINIETQDTIPAVSENQATVGVDLGIKSMIVLSDGTVFENPKALKSNLRRLKIRQRIMTKKQKGSKNRNKAQMRLARHHYRVANIRSNSIQKATSFITKNYSKIVVEDLKVSDMKKNRNLCKSIGDVGFYELKRQLTYKALWQGKELVVADQWYASSKLCSGCGNKKDKLKLSERIYNCDKCGLEIDRDLNAARNLASYSPTSELEESYAFGGSETMPSGKCLPVNEEILL